MLKGQTLSNMMSAQTNLGEHNTVFKNNKQTRLGYQSKTRVFFLSKIGDSKQS